MPSDESNFAKIINCLRELHRKYPDMAFPHVVQQAIDSHKKGFNKCLHDFNDKEFLTAIQEFCDATDSKRGNS